MNAVSDRYRLGIDVGGTFTDLLLMNERDGGIATLKVPSTPSAPEQAIIDGIKALKARFGIDPAQISYFSHGTTLGVNTLLQRNGGNVGVITTRGFRDIFELRRLRLSKANDLFVPKPVPLVPRHRVIEVGERLLQDGSVLAPLDRNEVIAAAEQLVATDADSVAICFLHAYRSDVHERAAKSWIEQRFPGLYVCTSAEIWPQQREFERSLVSVINAYIGARMRSYFDTLVAEVRRLRLGCRVFSTRSNGGVMSLPAAFARPVDTLLSGPASGVIGAAHVGQMIGEHQIITLDMGGTSVDMAVINGDVPASTESTIGDFPVVLPAVDVSAIGAGGGSIAWLDVEGVLKVGPRSAGARPGPACYGLGGSEPTVTDAYVTLGICGGKGLLGGEMPLDPAKARAAIAPLAERLGRTIEQTADAILQVATANIYAELVPQLARRGVDAGDFSLLAYGAAGPTHVFMLARETNFRRIIVPPTPGLLCALGCLVADLRADFVRSLWADCGDLTDGQLDDIYGGLKAEARAWLENESAEIAETYLVLSADLCYRGQSFEINVVFPEEKITVANVERWFHQRYEQVYGYADRGATVKLLEARVQIIGRTQKPVFDSQPAAQHPVEVRDRRPLYEQGAWVDAAIVQRADLLSGAVLQGPVVVEQYDTTVYVPAGFRVSVDAWGNLIGERLA